MWSVASKSLVGTCIGHTSGVMAVAAMPDGQRILSGGHDHSVRMWLLDGTHVNMFVELNAHYQLVGGVYALVAMPDNQHALCGSWGGIQLFNVNDGAVLRNFKDDNMRRFKHVFSLALLPDGLRFVSGDEHGRACIVYHGLAPC